MESRELFSIKLLTDDEMINAAITALDVSKENILIIHKSDGWLKRKDESIVFESVGLLDESDTDDYIGYYYYNIYFYENEFLHKLKCLETEFETKVIVEI